MNEPQEMSVARGIVKAELKVWPPKLGKPNKKALFTALRYLIEVKGGMSWINKYRSTIYKKAKGRLLLWYKRGRWEYNLYLTKDMALELSTKSTPISGLKRQHNPREHPHS